VETEILWQRANSTARLKILQPTDNCVARSY